MTGKTCRQWLKSVVKPQNARVSRNLVNQEEKKQDPQHISFSLLTSDGWDGANILMLFIDLNYLTISASVCAVLSISILPNSNRVTSAAAVFPLKQSSIVLGEDNPAPSSFANCQQYNVFHEKPLNFCVWIKENLQIIQFGHPEIW